MWEKLLKKTVDVIKDVGGDILDDIEGSPREFKVYFEEHDATAYKIFIKGTMPIVNKDTIFRVRALDKYATEKYPSANSSENPMYTSSLIPDLNDDEGYWGYKMNLPSNLSGMAIKKFLVQFFVPNLHLTQFSGNRTILFRFSYYNAEKKQWFIHKQVERNFFIPNGEEDLKEQLNLSKELILKIGLAIAFADGSVDKNESTLIKELGNKLAGNDEEFKKQLNNVIKETYSSYKNQSFSYIKNSVITHVKEFNDNANEPEKYVLVEFCYNMMAADKEAHKNELELLDEVKKIIDIEKDYFQKLSDQKLVELETDSVESNIEKVLSIDSSWSNDKIQAHLAKEFQKWNGRLNTIKDPEKRDKAQNMLNLIAKAKKKYTN